jgi:hypothetical protein
LKQAVIKIIRIGEIFIRSHIYLEVKIGDKMPYKQLIGQLMAVAKLIV